VAVALGQSRQLPVFADFASIEDARSWLQESLNEVTAVAQQSITSFFNFK
jgi:hypothetical protein